MCTTSLTTCAVVLMLIHLYSAHQPQLPPRAQGLRGSKFEDEERPSANGHIGLSNAPTQGAEEFELEGLMSEDEEIHPAGTNGKLRSG